MKQTDTVTSGAYLLYTQKPQAKIAVWLVDGTYEHTLETSTIYASTSIACVAAAGEGQVP